jgi:hypothetical protein
MVLAIYSRHKIKKSSVSYYEDRDGMTILIVILFVLVFVPTFIGVGIHVDSSLRIAQLQAYHDANFEIDKTYQFDDTMFASAEKYNMKLAELRAEDNNIWIGLAIPHVPKDLDYIKVEDLAS